MLVGSVLPSPWWRGLCAFTYVSYQMRVVLVLCCERYVSRLRQAAFVLSLCQVSSCCICSLVSPGASVVVLLNSLLQRPFMAQPLHMKLPGPIMLKNKKRKWIASIAFFILQLWSQSSSVHASCEIQCLRTCRFCATSAGEKNYTCDDWIKIPADFFKHCEAPV